MIISSLIGGLGNQLFQYAAGRYLAEIHQVDFKIDTSHFETYRLHKYSLHHFNIGAKLATLEEVKHYSSLSNRFFDLISFKPYYRRRFFKEQFFDFDENFKKSSSDTMISGYWQTEKYFNEIKHVLFNEFSIVTPICEQSQKIAAEISGVNSVSLHIRRGDYVSDLKTNKVHGICDESYYTNCVNLISRQVKDPVFYIFSDEPDWVKVNFKLKYPVVYVCHNDEARNYDDIRLMSYCKHNIIANSSFSWWGAWLNLNPDKLIFAPKRWFKTTGRNAKDIIPDKWIKV